MVRKRKQGKVKRKYMGWEAYFWIRRAKWSRYAFNNPSIIGFLCRWFELKGCELSWANPLLSFSHISSPNLDIHQLSTCWVCWDSVLHLETTSNLGNPESSSLKGKWDIQFDMAKKLIPCNTICLEIGEKWDVGYSLATSSAQDNQRETNPQVPSDVALPQIEKQIDHNI